jgi:uncharacterized protein involved in type VI secretion and phage assembly
MSDADALAVLLRTAPPGAGDGRFHGVWPATVSDNQDPDGQARVKVSLAFAADGGGGPACELWARLATLMAGANRGSLFVPDAGDEVLVGFLGGDPSQPYVLGALWNGQDQPPESVDANNTKKLVRSRNGVKITLDDTDGTEKLLLETPGGTKVSLVDGPSALTIEDANGNSVKLESSGVTVTAASKLTLKASTAELTAGTVTVNAGMSTFSGVVKCDTLITNSVVSSSYTPGAGNIW